jgi:hypothetical protein
VIEEELTTLLLTLCDEVWALHLPDNPTYPAVTYQKVTSGRYTTHDGPSGLAWPRYQISVLAETFDECKEAAEEMRIGLDGYKGTDILGIFVENEIDSYTPESGVYSVYIDVRVWCREETVYTS